MSLVRDRCSAERTRLDPADLLADPRTRVLELVGDRALVVDAPGAPGPRLSLRSPGAADHEADVPLFLGRDDEDRPVLAVVRPAPETPATEALPDGHAWQTLREVGPWLPDDEVEAFMTAQGLGGWHRTHHFCPRCGAPTEPGACGWVRRCTADGRESYPRTDPAVIMAVVDDADRILLGRSPAWPENRRSVLAGFVEPGESLEDAVRREVAEEVGVRVGDVAYVGSQAWPFPGSLMVGFVATALTVDVRCDPEEIAQAEWYDRAGLRAAVAAGQVALPGRMSIARRLIEGWLGGTIDVPGVDERGAAPWHRDR